MLNKTQTRVRPRRMSGQFPGLHCWASRVLLARVHVVACWIHDVPETRAQKWATFRDAIGVPDLLAMSIAHEPTLEDGRNIFADGLTKPRWVFELRIRAAIQALRKLQTCCKGSRIVLELLVGRLPVLILVIWHVLQNGVARLAFMDTRNCRDILRTVEHTLFLASVTDADGRLVHDCGVRHPLLHDLPYTSALFRPSDSPIVFPDVLLDGKKI